jgi:putative transposase
MARPLRIEYSGAYYHVMNRGLGRTRIFLKDRDRYRFLDLLGEITRLWKVSVYAYCLMDNHYHLLLQTPQGNLSRVMRHLDGVYTQSFNRTHGRDGPLFRGRYRALLVDADEYFLSVARYIHHNPQEAGIETAIKDYPWSSHRAYLLEKHCPSWINRQGMLSRFGKEAESLQAYRVFMENDVETQIKDFYKKRSGSVLGGKEFLKQVKERIGRRARPTDEIPESRWIFAPEVGEILKVTARLYGKSTRELLKSRRGVPNEPRAMAIYLCRALGGHKLSVIADAVGMKNYSSASSAYLGMKQRIANDSRLARQINKLEKSLESQKQT